MAPPKKGPKRLQPGTGQLNLFGDTHTAQAQAPAQARPAPQQTTTAPGAIPGFNLGTIPASSLPAGPSSAFVPRQIGAPAAPTGPSSNYVRGNPAPPAAQAPPSRLGALADNVMRQWGAANAKNAKGHPTTAQGAAWQGFKRMNTASPYNLDTAMQRRWSPESKALVYGRGVSEPGTPPIRTEMHHGAHQTMGGGPKIPEGPTSPGWTPYGRGLNGSDLGSPPDFQAHHPPGSPPPGLVGGGGQTPYVSPGAPMDYLHAGSTNTSGGGNPWMNQHQATVNGGKFWDPHTELTSGVNARPVQGISSDTLPQ